ncbi:discoidin domain-containing protein [Streptacidiphilus neutrinimicus]|uniref:discoidin domain-containing protein n=1 Tax=Streptacidiphilus neutrinimicus TaxID=105420 RepID=UPI0005A5FBAD|nr:discoidin domain-containing protein [Streptacidiphilus neutrinimicus]
MTPRSAARPRRRTDLPALAALLLAAPLIALPTGPAHADTPIPRQPAGADVSFTEDNAATSPHARTNGAVLGPDYRYGSLASEATGRTAVQLVGRGRYVSFTLTRPANAVDFHYALPDSLHGGGINAPLELYVDGRAEAALTLTSQFSWLYGTYPFSNNPSVGKPDGQVPHDFYNDVRYRFGRTLPAGTVVKLQVDAGDNAPWYVVNTADFEQAPAPAAKPDGYLDATAYGVDATGATDTTAALQHAVDAASAAGRGLYLPAGTYTLSAPLNVDQVTIAGAGEWYTVLTGHNVSFAGKQNPPSSHVDISDLAIFGNVDVRDDSNSADTGFNGGFSDSRISHVWIQNEKVGAWIIGPSTNLTLDHLRIQDTTADGVNLNAADGPVTHALITQNFLRNTQDDGLALWSENYGDTADALVRNTVDSPGLANNIGVYGAGADDVIAGNLLQDTVTRGGGIGIGQRFGSVPMSGPLAVTGNTLVRTGQWDPGWDYGVGAIWFDPQQGSMTAPVEIRGNDIVDSPYSAFMFQNSAAYTGAAVTTPPSGGNAVTNVTIDDNRVSGVGSYVFQDQAPGAVTVSGLHADGVGIAGVFSCGAGFALKDAGGDSGWKHAPVCGMPARSALWAYPGSTTFEAATTGQATPAQKVVVANTGATSATLGQVTASPGFSVAPDPAHPCGATLDAADPTDPATWCVLDVTFTPQHDGLTRGALTLQATGGGKPTAVQLVGSTDPLGGDGGVAPPSNLALGATLTASSALPGFPATNANDDNSGSYWESQDGSAFPQSLTADLGTAQQERSVVLTLPPNWGARTQTLAVLGSTDGSTWTTLVPAADHVFDPASADTVTLTLPVGTNERYLQVVVAGNTGWPAAQLSEFEIFD